MANFFTDNDDLQWQYRHGFKWEALASAAEDGFTAPGGHKDLAEAQAFYDEVLTLLGSLAAEEIAPRAAAIDRIGAQLVDGEVVMPKDSEIILAKFRDAGAMGLNSPRALGGSQCPLAVSFISNELLARADVSTMSHIGFHGGTAVVLQTFAALEGNPHRFDADVRAIAAGEAWGCMVMTEPDAGSDLGAMRTTATLRDGTWRINGNKIFITSGSGQYHIVLARSETGSSDTDAAGLKGLSLFLVRRFIERDGKRIRNVTVDKVEHKLGHNGSPTCSLVYDNSEAELIGKRGQGFELMLFMMNGARVAVGFEAVGLCESAFRMAFAYAKERRSMGKAIAEHELIAEALMDMQLDIAGMRALSVACANDTELGTQLRDPVLAQKHKRRARDRTPLLKYIAAEKAVEHARKNMQIHGGSGYMREYGAEKLMRDALVIPVYEGTSQIQALMVLKDRLLGVMRQPTRLAKQMSAASIGATTAKSELERNVHQARLESCKAITHLIGRVAGGKMRKDFGKALRDLPAHEWPRYLTQDFMREWDAKVDFSIGLLHAERLTKLLCDVEIATLLARQAAAFPERRTLAERYARRMMPRVHALSQEIRNGDTTVLAWIEEQRQ